MYNINLNFTNRSHQREDVFYLVRFDLEKNSQNSVQLFSTECSILFEISYFLKKIFLFILFSKHSLSVFQTLSFTINPHL